jgi:AcrR family transcriptional regulator
MSPRSITEEEFLERESELISLGRSLVDNDCLTSLTIDKLVAESRFSKGTIYKHFTSKEDLLMAICNRSIKEMQDMFIQALEFKGNSREKVLAVMVSYVIWAKLHPMQLFAVLAAHSPSVAACCSEVRNETHKKHEAKLMGLMARQIEKAIQSGDLKLPEGMLVEQVTFAMWAASWGAMALIMSKGDSVKLGPMQLERESFTNARLILDGLGWKPLSSTWDYAATIHKIATEVFQSEIAILEKMGTPFIFI